MPTATGECQREGEDHGTVVRAHAVPFVNALSNVLWQNVKDNWHGFTGFGESELVFQRSGKIANQGKDMHAWKTPLQHLRS